MDKSRQSTAGQGTLDQRGKSKPSPKLLLFLIYLVFFVSFLENQMNNSMKTLFPVFDEHFRFSITFPLNVSVLLRLYSTITTLNAFLFSVEEKRCQHKEKVKNGGNLGLIGNAGCQRARGKMGVWKRGREQMSKTGNRILWLGETAGNVHPNRKKKRAARVSRGCVEWRKVQL